MSQINSYFTCLWSGNASHAARYIRHSSFASLMNPFHASGQNPRFSTALLHWDDRRSQFDSSSTSLFLSFWRSFKHYNLYWIGGQGNLLHWWWRSSMLYSLSVLLCWDYVTVFLHFLLSLWHLLRLRFLVPFNRYTFSIYSLYSFALLVAATRIASPFLFHHSYALLPFSYALPLGLCTFSSSINTASFPM